MPKPGKDHPWNVRTRAQVLAADKKKGRKKSPYGASVFEMLLEEERAKELEEDQEITRQVQEFFQ